MTQRESTSFGDNKKSSLTLSIFIRQLLRGWPWFLLAFILYLAISYRFAPNLAFGVSEYKMTLMSRFGKEAETLIQENTEKKLSWERELPYTAEQLYGFLLSSDLIYQAGKRVGFEVDYTQKHKFRTYDVFNDIPFRLLFLDTYDTDELNLEAKWLDGTVELSKIKGFFKGGKIDNYNSFVAQVSLGDTINSPAGRIACIAQAPSERYPHTSLDLSLPICVKKIDANRAKTLFDRDMQLERMEGRSMNLNISAAGSMRRVTEVMGAMIEVCEERMRELLTKDLEENELFLKEALAKLDSLPADSPSVREEKALLQEKLARNETNKQSLQMAELITVTDPPSGRPPKSATGYFKLILLILLATGAILVVYYTRIGRGILFSEDQLPTKLRKRLLGRYKYQPKKDKQFTEEQLLDTDSVRFAFEGTQQLFVASTAKPREALWFSSLLATNFSRSGRRVLRIHYHSEGEKPPVSCQGIAVKAGYLGSDAFWKDLASLRESYGAETLFVISAKPCLQRQLIPLFQDILFVVVGEKSKLRTINKYATLLALEESDDSPTDYATVWIDLPLTCSTRK